MVFLNGIWKNIVGDAGVEVNEEDLSIEDDGKLKLSDRKYDSSIFSGKGYKILRKNIVNGVNVLTQDMINDSDTIYEIRYNYDLNNQEIVIPDKCILKFNGGSLSNGKLHYNNTILKNHNFSNIQGYGVISNKIVTYDMGEDTLIIDTLQYNNSNVSIIDLQNNEVTLNGINIEKNKDIIIKNGILNITSVCKLQTGDYKFILDNIILYLGTIKKNAGFIGSLEVDNNPHPTIVAINSKFINFNTQYIENVFYNNFKSLYVRYCEFIDCGAQVRTHNLGISEWNINGVVSFDHCTFKWDRTKSSNYNGGNSDAIACNTYDNIFVTNCSFDNISNSCLDCYTTSNIIFSNNKLNNCDAGLELKSIYRESDWSADVGNRELPRSHNILITNNIFSNTKKVINTGIFVQSDQEGDFTYFISKSDKYKRNMLISNNLVYFTDIIKGKSYFIVGDPIMNTLISNNVFYTEVSNYIFLRDRNDTDLSILQYFSPKVTITNCLITAPTNSTIIISNYSDYMIKNCICTNQIMMQFNGSEYNDNNINISECSNITIDTGRNSKSNKIKVVNCTNVRAIVRDVLSILEFINCEVDSSAYLINFATTKQNTHKNIFICKNTKGLINESSQVNNIIILDDLSYCRKNSSNSPSSDYKFIKPFNRFSDLNSSTLLVNGCVYYKNDNNNYIKYTYNRAIDKWINEMGNSDDILTSGTFSQKPTSSQGIQQGFSYYCTDKQTSEGSRNGIMIYYSGDDTWVDSLGRIVD